MNGINKYGPNYGTFNTTTPPVSSSSTSTLVTRTLTAVKETPVFDPATKVDAVKKGELTLVGRVSVGAGAEKKESFLSKLSGGFSSFVSGMLIPEE